MNSPEQFADLLAEVIALAKRAITADLTGMTGSPDDGT